MGALGDGPFGVGLRAAGVGGRDGGGTGAHGWVVGERRARAGGEIGPVGGELGRDGVRAVRQPPGERDDLGGLLAGEGEPAQDLRFDVALDGGVQRYVQQ